jgi:Flp pilus assembly protein TadD
MGRNEEAIRHLTEALRLVPIDAEAHFDLGCLLAESGRRDEAVKSLKEALRLKPGYADAERELRALDTRPPE